MTASSLRLPSASLTEKSLKITFLFPKNLENPLIIEDLQTEALIQTTGQTSGSIAKIKIHAVTLEKIFQMASGNQLPLAKTPLMLSLSGACVMIDGGDKKHSSSTIFHGKISTCHACFAPPHRLFEITAHSILLYNSQIIPASSCQKPVTASKMLEDICAFQDIALENNGIEYVLQPPFSVHGTFLQQIKKIVNPQQGFFHIDPLANKLLVAKENFSRPSENLILEAKELIDFPIFSEQLLCVRSLFQPAAALGQNLSLNASPLIVENIALNHQYTVTPPWNGQWIVHSFSHRLSSRKNIIFWETHINAHRLH